MVRRQHNDRKSTCTHAEGNFATAKWRNNDRFQTKSTLVSPTVELKHLSAHLQVERIHFVVRTVVTVMSRSMSDGN
jgi:hypothetical protein